ncbi:hypothetical protein VD0004_g3176 [Verticillium dahliae]|uniref:R3H-associated N-terminal domain-containing protein n=1 Tax=Verticillium dahliae TaxID=27337 RepID=A0A444RQM8_VERDA|nr:hypothetical protein VD0004_g3176 [Verticillium dahliae]PNH74823.1 hypothetical protein VD0001_g2774 [Verticillium dahliae]RXG43449.1 hypothetical protein VDGE_00796 [Verticillium dahliae]
MPGLYSAVPPPSEAPRPVASPAAKAASPSPRTPSRQINHATPPGVIDIEAWTISALQSLSVSPIARGTGSPLTIPLDEAPKQKEDKTQAEGTRRTVTIAVDPRADPIRRPLSRRDSLKSRDAALKGSEGSRQRRRWENDRLIGVPNAQPPIPSDFEPRPTHPIHHVPYHLAAFWDRDSPTSASVRQRLDTKSLAQQARRKTQQLANGSATGRGAGMVPRDLRDYTKRSPAIKNWVRFLEEPVRNFVRQQRGDAPVDEDTDAEGLDSEDEEIVFVGRKNQPTPAAAAAKAQGWKKATRDDGSGNLETGVVFDELGDDESASFKRWLTHSISDYYGLESRSVTTGTPARRVVYIGSKQLETKHRGPNAIDDLPPPLWEIC